MTCDLSVWPTWFTLEGQDGLDPRLFAGAEVSVSVHQPEVVAYFCFLWRGEEAAQADGPSILICRHTDRWRYHL